MKLPHLPNKCSVLEAKYSAQQMREYAHKSIREYLNESYKQPLTMEPMETPAYKSIVEKIKGAW